MRADADFFQVPSDEPRPDKEEVRPYFFIIFYKLSAVCKYFSLSGIIVPFPALVA